MKLTRRDFIKSITLAAGGTFLGTRALGAGSRRNAVKSSTPGYEKMKKKGDLSGRIEEAWAKLENCDLCPHKCGVNRLRGQTGFCRAGAEAVVHSSSPHFGEELPLVGRNGSGTIFFSHCNLRCVFCQNWPIAHEGRGRRVSNDELADLMLSLQRRGCHNINLVTPTHMMPFILKAVNIAHGKGLHLPLCYNTGGYETEECIELLDGIVDIYLPDIKFMDGEYADKYVFTGARDYPERARKAVILMHRQVGDLQTDSAGIALRGLMLRHLVMPNRVAGTREFVKWVAENLSEETYVNIMSQYRVEHRAFEYDKIARAITAEEFEEAIRWAREAGLKNLDARSESRLERFRRMLR